MKIVANMLSFENNGKKQPKQWISIVTIACLLQFFSGIFAKRRVKICGLHWTIKLHLKMPGHHYTFEEYLFHL